MCGWFDDMTEKWLLGLFLLINTYWDIKDREIRLWSILVFGLGKILIDSMCGRATPEDWLAGIFPGLIMLCAARLTRGAIGYGDGFAVVVCGIYIGFAQTFSVVFYALTFCLLVSAILIVAGKRTGKTSVPFLPYLLVGYGCICRFSFL